MDPLSDILSLLNVESGLSARLEAGGEWSLRFPSYTHVKFGAALKGSCWLSTEGAAPVFLEQEDCYLLTNGRPYSVASNPSLPPIDALPLWEKAGGKVFQYNGTTTALVGASFRFDTANARLLLDLLPPVIHIPGRVKAAAALRATLNLLLEETNTEIGTDLMTDRLANILFVQALRSYILSEQHVAASWLRGLADKRIGVALRLMHSNIARRWTVSELAAESNMSRSNFALMFKRLVGLAPLDYLLQWRMQRAKHELRDGGRKVSSIAATLGYGSENAFANAFKRVTGSAPKQYWKTLRPANTSTQEAAE